MIDRRCTTQHATSSKMSANFLKKALFHNQMFSVEVGIGSSVGLNKAKTESRVRVTSRHGGYFEKAEI